MKALKILGLILLAVATVVAASALYLYVTYCGGHHNLFC